MKKIYSKKQKKASRMMMKIRRGNHFSSPKAQSMLLPKFNLSLVSKLVAGLMGQDRKP